MACSRRKNGIYANIVMRGETSASYMVSQIDRRAAEEAKRLAEARREAAGKRRIYVR